MPRRPQQRRDRELVERGEEDERAPAAATGASSGRATVRRRRAKPAPAALRGLVERAVELRQAAITGRSASARKRAR